MSVNLWPFLAVILVASPVLLPILKGEFDARSFGITSIVTVIAFAAPLIGFGDPEVVWKFFLAQTMLFASFVCVSRIRQRKSLFLMALAGIGSNGGWFLAMQVLAGAYLAQKHGLESKESVGFLVAAIAGTMAGRLVGVQWMTWVEKRWQVRTDSVGSATLRGLDEYAKTYLRHVFVGTWVVYSVLGYIFGIVSLIDLAVVMTLGFLQSQIYTINARFANRNHPGWPVVTGLVAGVVFMIHWAYLIGYTRSGGFMPMSLFIPYTVATVYGANSGAVLAMALEKVLGLKADAHVTGGESYKEVRWHRVVLIATAAVCGVYFFASEYMFNSLGIAVDMVTLPFTVFAGSGFERPAALFVGGAVFFFNNITHTLSSRAGNRNHAPYHAITCVVHGVVTFGTGTFVVLNAHFIDLIPVAAFGSALGQLVAQQWSMKMEKWLVSVMDVPEEKKASPKPA